MIIKTILFRLSLGPFGQGDDEQVFIQRVVPNTDTIFVRQSSSGHRLVSGSWYVPYWCVGKPFS